jgi:sialate O-acetylesterase
MTTMHLRLLILISFVSVGASAAAADVTVARLFSDGVVLQRERAVPVWGWADAGSTVTVAFAGQEVSATADAAGAWRATLAALPASSEPRTLTIRGSRTLTVNDVLVGDVWLASGQSNMGVPLSSAHNGAAALPLAQDPLLRFFTVTRTTAAEPARDVSGTWEATTPKTAGRFSAVAYFFARDLRARLNVPVAVIHSSWGGTPAQAWTSIAALRQDPPFTRYLDQWEAALTKHRQVVADPTLAETYRADLKQWQTEVAPAYNAAVKAHQAAKDGSPKPKPSRPEPVNPDPMGMPSPSARPNVPGVIVNGMIAPLAPYALRGVLWYQGEANGGDGFGYRSLLPRLIGDWRSQFQRADLPFLIVQLAGWDHDTRGAEFHDWPYLREAQLLTSRTVPHTGLAVLSDLGDPKDVHPANKADVGARLALAARSVAYGETLVASGPLLAEHVREGTAMRLRFSEVGSGLVIGQAPWVAAGQQPLPTDRLLGFAIAGADRRWHDADARIDGDRVVVSSPAVSEPQAVRYGWANAPRGNLYNREGLPASPFRTDDWKPPTP